MIQSSWLCEAPRSIASCCWATLRPETEATTATRARIIAIRMLRRRLGSVTTVDVFTLTVVGAVVAGAVVVGAAVVLTFGALFGVSFSTKRYRTVSDRQKFGELDETLVTGTVSTGDGRSDCPHPCRGPAHGDRPAGRGRPVGGHDRCHRRPIRGRQVHDLSALGVA